MPASEQIEKAFAYHRPDQDQVNRMTFIRGHAKKLAEIVDQHCPDSREKSLALTNLEQTVMWANAAIAREG